MRERGREGGGGKESERGGRGVCVCERIKQQEQGIQFPSPNNGGGLSWFCDHGKYECVHIGEGVVLPV